MADTSYLESLQGGDGIDPKDRSTMSGSIIWTSAVLLGVVLVMAFARLIVRTCAQPTRSHIDHSRAIGSDDYFILGATAATLSLAVFSIVGARNGLGRHILDILREHSDPKLEATRRLIIMLYGCYISYAIANTLTKLSIIASYLRIFPSMKFRRLMWFIGTCVVLQGFISVVTIIFECDPPASSWNWNIKRKRCIDIQLFFYITSGINTATDFTLWVAPMGYFWKSRMARRQKLELIMLYSIGFVGCLAGLFRMGQLKGLKSMDITYTGVLPLNCSMAEVSFGIVCACIPPLRPALRPIMQRLRLISGSPPVSKDTPVSTPQLNSPQYFERRRTLSRIEETGGIIYAENHNLDEFEGNFRQYLGSSMASLRPTASETPSEAGTIGERGSATSERLFV